MKHIRLHHLFLGAFFAISYMSSAIAAELSSLTIEQVSPSKIGVWTLLRADGGSITSADPTNDPHKYTAGISNFGQMVLRVSPPAGMVAKISVYTGEELIAETASQQHAFTLLPGLNFRFIVQYRLANMGLLGVISELKGVTFKMKSADGRTYRAVTPKAWNSLPIGKYTIYANALPGCFKPAPQNVEVKMEERTVVSISQTCEGAEGTFSTVERVRPSKRTIQNDVLIREARRR